MSFLNNLPFCYGCSNSPPVPYGFGSNVNGFVVPNRGPPKREGVGYFFSYFGGTGVQEKRELLKSPVGVF